MKSLDYYIQVVNNSDQKLRRRLEKEYYESEIDCDAFLKRHGHSELARAIVALR